ncbi:pentapeptide repeat-containing protein, partial [Nocardia sp. NPDC051900]|uniref:pentapeptide repeat-containing protein n=1 Tax=Nocardia sp. NPDC051900 TaxID=3364326 RepID=UPI0037AC9BBB
TFTGNALFDTVIFDAGAEFRAATFSGARFREATFSGGTSFRKATFTGIAWFDKAAFSGKASFVGTDFGSEHVSFAAPQQWGPPPPEFDWGEDGPGKPTNVEPRDWPPTVSPV